VSKSDSGLPFLKRRGETKSRRGERYGQDGGQNIAHSLREKRIRYLGKERGKGKALVGMLAHWGNFFKKKGEEKGGVCHKERKKPKVPDTARKSWGGKVLRGIEGGEGKKCWVGGGRWGGQNRGKWGLTWEGGK